MITFRLEIEVCELTKLETFSKEQLIDRVGFLEAEVMRVVRENYELRNQSVTELQIKLLIEEQLGQAMSTLYGSSSERYKNPMGPNEEKIKEPLRPRIKKPSERYPNIPVREELIKFEVAPSCTACGSQMTEMGVTEDSERLTVIPKKFEIIRIKRMKYRCKCHGCVVTAATLARIIEGSSFSDEMILDVALSKYCDLIPVERYCMMASRGGLKDLPPHSLIETTHQLAEFLYPAYEKLKEGILSSKVLHADETPHKMLEGSETKNWYLWGFANERHSYFECHNTRSGDVASEILKNSQCQYLMSDVYSGYGKAVRVVNLEREKDKKDSIQNVHCNAHARRYFFKSWQSKYKEAQFYLDSYQEIYKLYSLEKNKAPPYILESRVEMKKYFEAMFGHASGELCRYPEKNQYGKALRYFLGNYTGLTKFLDDVEIPIDNNLQERLLRSHVVGRKTWYGTHSKLGAKTAAILFSIVESCKLNAVNPREYFPQLTKDLLAGKAVYTPFEFKDLA
jgi:transposase